MTQHWIENLTFLKFLLSIEGIGSQKVITLITKFKSKDELFNSSISTFTNIEGIGSVLGKRIINTKNKYPAIIDSTQRELELLEKINAKVITFFDGEYPRLLKEIYYPPLILYTKGEKLSNDSISLAIVGTRMPSIYGKTNVELFTNALVSRGFCIVSGGARGIDSIAHQTTLKTAGKTIAVIGSGLDIVYPPENKKLFDEITERGTIISEFSLGTKPDAQNFPRRNRIISGLSLGILIIETKINGGAMQTAAYAIDQDREVFAVPGNINSKLSEGPNYLIQKGEAKLVNCADDILVELNISPQDKFESKLAVSNFELNLFEEKIWNIIDHEPKHIDEIANLSSLSISDCLVSLLTMEFKGVVIQLPGKMFSRIH